MEQYSAQSYQILCEFHYRNQEIQHFVHQGMPSPNNSVMMEETNSFVLKVTQETPLGKEKISKNDNIKRYSGVLYGSNHFATCYILLSHKIIIIIDGLFMN